MEKRSRKRTRNAQKSRTAKTLQILASRTEEWQHDLPEWLAIPAINCDSGNMQKASAAIAIWTLRSAEPMTERRILRQWKSESRKRTRNAQKSRTAKTLQILASRTEEWQHDLPEWLAIPAINCDSGNMQNIR